MLDYDVVTAKNLISIGIAIGNTQPSFLISGTKLTKMEVKDLLTYLAENDETKSLPMLIIAGDSENYDDLINLYKNERKISVLHEPLDIHQFKREVESLS
jgi:hypothetical protein